MSWFRAPRADATARVFMFPHAGGGAAASRGWSDAFPGNVDVLGAVPPGRETRLREAPFDAMAPLVASLVTDALPLVRRVPWAAYGHSMGAWVAFELVRALHRRGGPLPAALIVGARRAPHVLDPLPPLSALPRDRFIDEVQRRYQAIPPALLASPEILDLFLPALRADFQLLDGYQSGPVEPLPVPIIALRGQDDPTVDAEATRAWAAWTSATFAAHTVPGGHFFFDAQRDLIAGMLTRALR